jgi:hypothetical protein
LIHNLQSSTAQENSLESTEDSGERPEGNFVIATEDESDQGDFGSLDVPVQTIEAIVDALLNGLSDKVILSLGSIDFHLIVASSRIQLFVGLPRRASDASPCV